MLYSQSPPLAEEQEWQTAQEASAGKPAHEQEARAEPRFGRRPMAASTHSLPPARKRPSLVRRMFRALTRFSIAVLIGVGATLGWQAYGDTAREMLAAQAPELARLLPVPATRSPLAAATPASPALQLEPLASNLEIVRRSVEQLAVRQEQLVQNIAALRVVDEDIRMKLALAAQPPAAAQPAAPIPQPKPAPPKAQPAAAPSSSAPRPPSPAGPVSLVPR